VTIADLNAAPREVFVAAVGIAFENSPWIAEAAWNRRPFADVDELCGTMIEIVRTAPEDRRIALIAAHPDLGGRVAREGRLTPASRGEQAAAGLDRLTSEEISRFEDLNSAYRSRFGFPFVICAREHSVESILHALAIRAENDRAAEIAAAVDEIEKIARLRLQDAIVA
jgi:2-oxo-4-hydroxy-4-carboxy-5-ureidoimidazoline decarboxylase